MYKPLDEKGGTYCTDRQTHTHTQTDYCNPQTCAASVNEEAAASCASTLAMSVQ